MAEQMPAVDMQRKLAAIFSTDVAGYSCLMGDDEEATIHTLTAYRAVISSLIHQHRGRVVDSPGDNLLAEFASVVDAVRCAVEIQHALQVKNAELPEHRQMRFRIGINLGDVIIKGERLYGDGVNIAARLEGLAIPGGICISGTAYDQVETKLALTYDYQGEQEVKNILKPVRVVSVTQQIDLNGAVGRMLASVMFGLAEIEQEYRRECQAAAIPAAKRKGVYRGRKKGTTKVPPARVQQLRARGLTTPEIATALGVHPRTVFRYLAEERP